jgi:hypothetical protein
MIALHSDESYKIGRPTSLGRNLSMILLFHDVLGACQYEVHGVPSPHAYWPNERHSNYLEPAIRGIQQTPDYFFFSQTPFPTTHSGSKSLSWRARVSPTT